MAEILDPWRLKLTAEIFACAEKKPLITAIKGATGESFSGGGIRACALAMSIGKKYFAACGGAYKSPATAAVYRREEKRYWKLITRLLPVFLLAGLTRI